MFYFQSQNYFYKEIQFQLHQEFLFAHRLQNQNKLNVCFSGLFVGILPVEMICYFFRCLQSVCGARSDAMFSPLYVLAFPEDLQTNVLDAVVAIMQNRLLTSAALVNSKDIPYALAIVTGDSENRLAQMLEQF